MADNTDKTPDVVAAFVIGFDQDGNPFINPKQEALTFETRREASMIEIRRYLSEILMDLQAQATSEYVAIRLSPTTPSGLVIPNGA